jgi:hypothetical protein
MDFVDFVSQILVLNQGKLEITNSVEPINITRKKACNFAVAFYTVFLGFS